LDPVRRLGHHHHEADRPLAVVGVPVGPVGAEDHGRALADRVALAVHGEGELPLEDGEHLPGARRVRVPVVVLTGAEPPVPQLEDGRRVGADQQPRRAAGAVLEGHGLGRLNDPHHRDVGDFDQPADADAERLGDPVEGVDAGVRPALLDLDEHAPANLRPGGQRVEGHPALAPQAPHVRGDRGVDRLGVGHGYSLLCFKVNLLYFPRSLVAPTAPGGRTVTVAALATAAAAILGTADFLGGLAARRSRLIAVVLVSQLGGLLVTGLLLSLLPGTPSAPALLWGMASGVTGATAIA